MKNKKKMAYDSYRRFGSRRLGSLYSPYDTYNTPYGSDYNYGSSYFDRDPMYEDSPAYYEDRIFDDERLEYERPTYRRSKLIANPGDLRKTSNTN